MNFKVKLFKQKQSHFKPAPEAGFTMLELLLGVIVFAGLLIAVFQVLEDLAEREQARGTASYTERVADSIEQTLTSDLNIFTLFYNDIIAQNEAALGVGACSVAGAVCALEIPVADDGVSAFNFVEGGNIGGVPVEGSAVLGEGFSDTNPLRSDIVAILSIANDLSVAGSVPALHVLIVGTELSVDDVVREAASESGPAGGFFRLASDPPVATDIIQSAYGTWSFELSQFIDPIEFAAGTSWFDEILANPPAPVAAPTRSYYVYYRYINFNDSSGDYLYRQPQSDPELHVMYSDLNLGGNNILGVDNMVVEGDVSIDNQVIVQGAANIAGDLSVAGSLIGDGGLEVNTLTLDHLAASTATDEFGVARPLNLNSATFNDAALGLGGSNNLLSDGVLTVNTMNMTDGGNIESDLSTLNNGADVDNLDVARQPGIPNNGEATLNGNFDADGFVAITNLSVANGSNVRIRGQANFVSLETTGAIDARNGEVGVLQINNEGNLDVTGTTQAEQISVNNINLSAGSFGACDNGCGN